MRLYSAPIVSLAAHWRDVERCWPDAVSGGHEWLEDTASLCELEGWLSKDIRKCTTWTIIVVQLSKNTRRTWMGPWKWKDAGQGGAEYMQDSPPILSDT